MGNTWQAKVWAQFNAGKITRTYRDVLLQLPKFRGRGGQIFPSHQSLADRAKCSVKSVGRALAAGRSLGLLVWSERYNKVGNWAIERTSNLYVLLTGNDGNPPDGPGGGVTSSKESSSSNTTHFVDPMASRARDSLLAVAARRAEKFAHEWLEARAGARNQHLGLA